MLSVALVTYQTSPEINEHDLLAAEELRRRGVAVTPAVWDDPELDWAGFDCVVIRSAWDYYLKPDQYADWLHRLQQAGVPAGV